VILADDLTEEQAHGLEISWTAQEGDTLVNWISGGRKVNLAATQRYHELRDTNRQLIASARTQEKAEPAQAVKMYYKAIDLISGYAKIKREEGLLGRLIDEERRELGLSGELEALDRLTLCLVRLGRGGEAQHAADTYFAHFPADAALSRADAIKKRVAKAARRLRRQVP
jgi:hypothetical protein